MLSTQAKIDSYFLPAKSPNKKLSIYKTPQNLLSSPSTTEISTISDQQHDSTTMKSPLKKRRKVFNNCSTKNPRRSGKSSDKSVQQLQSLVKKSNPNQLYLDFGQESFGRQEICPACGMLTVHGLLEDAKQHQKVCRLYKQGVPFHSKNARVVAKINGGIIVEVSELLVHGYSMLDNLEHCRLT
jgi:zinc-finger of acetyl-transferase ESCO